MTYNYTAHGLNIQSQFPLPELLPAEGKTPDVLFRYGKAPVSLSGPACRNHTWEAAPGEFLLRVHEIASYFVRGGREIIVDRQPDSGDEDVRLFLLGTGMGALLFQRGLVALHGSAIQTGQGAVLFLGKSGSGKSTLLAAFVQRGYAMISDDLVGIGRDPQGGVQSMPALPRVRLWADAASMLGIQPGEMTAVRQDVEKYLLPIGNFCRRPLPVHAIFVLTTHNRPDLQIQPIRDEERFSWLCKYTYRKRIMQGLGVRDNHFKMAADLVKSVKTMCIVRRAGVVALSELAERVEAGWNRSESSSKAF